MAPLLAAVEDCFVARVRVGEAASSCSQIRSIVSQECSAIVATVVP